MSVVSEPRPEERTGRSRCLQCGARLADDQEWCVECGAARTLIHRPPDWRIPIAVIGAVIVAVLAGLLIALASLSSDANRTARAQATATVTAPSASAAAPTVARPQLATWAAGLPGWTVVLAVSRDKVGAEAFATRSVSAGTGVGLLNSSEHPSLKPGYWVVFSGRYPTQAAAQAQVASLVAKGNLGAKPALVGSPGGR